MLRGGGALTKFDAEFKFAKIQNSHVGGGGLTEFDAEFKFAKIQNSHVEGGGSRNLILSSNLLRSKIPMLRVEGGGLVEFDAESKFAKKKKNFFVKNFLSFRAKIGTILFWTLSTKWFPYTKYRRTTTNKIFRTSSR